MKKKDYKAPSSTLVELTAQTMLAESGEGTISISSSETITSDTDLGGNEFGRSNGKSFWDDDFED